MINKIHRQNAEALTRQEQPDMMFFIKAYKEGIDLDEAMRHSKNLFVASNFGTSSEAVKEYIQSNFKVTRPVKTRRRAIKAKSKE